MEKVQKIRILTSAERAEEVRKFVLPNSGDVMIAMVFGWAAFCFLLVIAGERILRQVARLATSQVVRDAILAGDETVLTAMMIVGCIGIIGLVIFCYTYKKTVIGSLFVALTFGSCTWIPLHNLAFIVKYLIIVFLASFGAIFIYKNFWRLVAAPFVRLLVLLFAWVAVIQLTLGGRQDDIWYVGTEVAFIFGFAIAYLYYIDSTAKLNEYNQVLAWSALVITGLHALAPFTVDTFLLGGRFQSMFNRATGFAVFFAPCVLVMFWMGMQESRNLQRQLFVGAGIVGLVLILWSGTRSAALGLVISIFMLWWVFRTRIFVYMFLAATLGLVAQIVGTSGEQDFQNLLERFQGREEDVEGGSGRFDIWISYFEVFVQSPIYGFSMSGVKRQFVTSGVASLVDQYGFKLKTTAPHNAFIGMAARFGAVGLFILLLPIFIALRRGQKVLTSSVIPHEEKRVYVLPVAMIVLICITAFFEDALGAKGKGTVSALLLYPSLLFCEIHGARLMKTYAVEKLGSQVRNVSKLSGRRKSEVLVER